MKRLIESIVMILICMSISTISPAQVIFQDDFSSGNLNNWTILSGGWDVINGEMCAITDGSTITANIETLTSYIFETDARFEAGLAWGIDFRYIDPWNRVRLDFAPGAPNQLNVIIYENGTLAAQPYAGSCTQYGGYSTQHYCKFVVEGSYFEVYFGNDPDNLDLLCTYTYPAFDSGTIRYEAWGYPPNVMSCFDNVLVTAEESPFTPDEFTQGLWHFDEAQGTYIAYDATGNGYDMVLQDGAEFTNAGLFAGGADLSDEDAKVNSSHLVGNGWDALTIDAFIFPTEITGPEHPIVERYRWHNVADPSYYLTISQDESLVGGVYLNDPGSVYSSATTPPGTIETDQWYHVAMTWSSGEPTRIFLNGEMIAESQQVHEGTVRAGDDPLTIGWFHDQGYGDFYFQGYIDEVRISDIDRYPVQGGNLFEPDEFTEALWHFNEAAGTYTAIDATGNGYDMALEDGAEFTSAGLYGGCADITDPDAKINSDYLIGNGWDELTIDAHIKLIEFNPDENPVVYRYEYYTTNPAYLITIMPGGEIYTVVYQNNGGHTAITTDPVINLHTWHYIQMTWASGGELKIFVDGTLVESATAGIGSIRNSTHQLTIGWFHDTGYGDFYSNGFIDEVRISDIDRSEQPPPPPILHDDFEDGNADGWTVVEGNWGIHSPGAGGSNHCYGTSCPIAETYPEEFTASFFELEVDFWIDNENTGNFDVEFNYQCANNHYMLDLADPDSDDPHARIYRYINGVETIIAETPNIVQQPAWHHLKLIRNTDYDIAVFLDNNPSPFIIVNDGELTHNSEVRFRFYAGGDIDNVFLTTTPPPPPIDIALAPYNPPIIIPPSGDAFAFNISLANNGGLPAVFDIWLNIEVPGGYQFTIQGPVYGYSLAPGASQNRDRTVFVPGSAPAGEYTCMGVIGTYPWNVIDSDAFPFIKEGVDGVWKDSKGWICSGESFPGEDISAGEALPEKFALHSAFPNPFNSSTTLSYSLPKAGKVSLVIYDVMGREAARLVDSWTPAGVYQMTFDAATLSSGIYFARMMAGDFQQTLKLLLVK